jgi:signal transduction histidine kinase
VTIRFRRSPADEAVVALQEQTSALAQAIRTLSHALHPSVLEHAGLVPTLKRHCAEIEEHHHVGVMFEGTGSLDGIRPDLALCLFRVAQEALTNAVRHARARTIIVRLEASPTAVDLAICDDGVGFAAGDPRGRGLGLRSIDERVRLTKGRVTVQSRPGLGTDLRVHLPLSPARDDVPEFS